MTMFFDDEFDRLFKKMSKNFFDVDDVFDELKSGHTVGPFYYGYTMTIGPDGKPIIKEYGNVKSGLLPTSDTRQPFVDTVVDEKDNLVRFVVEMPGVEKSDISVEVLNKQVKIDAEHGEKKYHTTVPIKNKIDENSAKASYKNGILELTFNIQKEERPKGKKVEIE